MSLVRPDSKSSLLPASRVASQMLLFPLLRPFLTLEHPFFLAPVEHPAFEDHFFYNFDAFETKLATFLVVVDIENEVSFLVSIYHGSGIPTIFPSARLSQGAIGKSC